MEKRDRKLAVETLVALAIAVTIGGLLLLNRHYQSVIEQKDAQISAFTATEPETEDTPTPDQATVPESESFGVAFTPGGLFDEAERQEITSKLIEPLVDFEREQGNVDDLASIHIQHPVEGDETTEYIVDIIYKSGGYQGFIYGDSTIDTQPWYQLSCGLGECEISEAYRQKYPEVVKEDEK